MIVGILYEYDMKCEVQISPNIDVDTRFFWIVLCLEGF